ncbi:serine dehydratase beta chain [Jeotgalibaca porci]|uniref:serine dehydratase beta chain n=1 Tax=Jeotgalibaca porci TaxID=1868793 RepID=UPI00359F80D5
MANTFRSVFDIIGPIMVGPSSSHTAGALALGKAAAQLFGMIPKKITIHYYESFADTHLGHGTDFAILGGILGLNADDPMLPKAVEMAASQQIAVSFFEEKDPSPVGHPNTARMILERDDLRIVATGSSIGGGSIELNEVEIGDFQMTINGHLPLYFIKQNSSHLGLFKLRDWEDFFTNHGYRLSDIRIFREEENEWVILYLETSPSKEMISEINTMPFIEQAILIR